MAGGAQPRSSASSDAVSITYAWHASCNIQVEAGTHERAGRVGKTEEQNENEIARIVVVGWKFDVCRSAIFCRRWGWPRLCRDSTARSRGGVCACSLPPRL